MKPKDILAVHPKTIEDFWQLLLPESCYGCPLHRDRTQIVANRGDGTNGLFFVGEAPGENEDEQGLPFIGIAGQLLNKMLVKSGIDPEKSWFSNSCKCRPRGNATPGSQEILACRPLLMKEIELVNPTLVISLGKPAMHSLSDDFRGSNAMGKAAGKMIYSPVMDAEFFATYHPSYVRRVRDDRNDKRDLYKECIAHFHRAAMIARTRKAAGDKLH